MPKQKSKFHAKTYLALGGMTVLLFWLVWLYSGEFSPLKKRIFAQLPLPVAKVGKNFIFWPEIAQRIQTSAALAMYDNVQVSAEALYNQILDDRLLEQISRNQGITPEAQTLTSEFQTLASQNGLSPARLENELRTKYRISQSDFMNLVLKPLQLRQRLQIWHSGNPDLNAESFTLAQKILTEIKSGKDFEELAQAYSRDESSRQLGGNLPALKQSELLPEIQKQLETQSPDKVQMIPSRLGLHILKILSGKSQTPEAEVKLQQIFLPDRQYANWYQNQARKIPVIKLRTSFKNNF